MSLESLPTESRFTLQADADNFDIEIERDEGTGTPGRIGRIDWITKNTSANEIQFGTIDVDADVVTAGSEKHQLYAKRIQRWNTD